MQRALALLLTSLALVQGAGAQAPSRPLRVRVLDEGALPVSGAEVVVLEGLRKIVAQGSTDAAGGRTLLLPAPEDTGRGFELTVRKLGFDRLTRYVRPRMGDTVSLIVKLARSAQSLDTVRVSERADIRKRLYHVSAEQIANSARYLGDGTDIVAKLRPDVLGGTRGPPKPARMISVTGSRPGRRTNFPDPTSRPVMTSSYGTQCTEPIDDIWINGKRVVFALDDATSLAARDPSSILGRVSGKILSTLALIRAEHVSELTYKECGDFSVEKARGDNALFVTLKPGVRFDRRRGTYVVPSDDDDSLVVSSAAMAYRRRVLEIVDASTGEPLQGVSVNRIGGEETVTTSPSGRTVLSFLPDGRWVLWIERTGYEPVQLDITIGPAEGGSVTVPLTRKPAQ